MREIGSGVYTRILSSLHRGHASPESSAILGAYEEEAYY